MPEATWDRFAYLLTTNPEFYLYCVLFLGCLVVGVIAISRLSWLIWEELRIWRYRRREDTDA